MSAQNSPPICIIGGVSGFGEILVRRLYAIGRKVVRTARVRDRAQVLAEKIGTFAGSCALHPFPRLGKTDPMAVPAQFLILADAGQIIGMDVRR